MKAVIDVSPGAVVVDGKHRVDVASGEDPHRAAVSWIARERADRAGEPVTVYAREDGKVTHLVVHPGDSVTDVRPMPDDFDVRDVLDTGTAEQDVDDTEPNTEPNTDPDDETEADHTAVVEPAADSGGITSPISAAPAPQRVTPVEQRAQSAASPDLLPAAHVNGHRPSVNGNGQDHPHVPEQMNLPDPQQPVPRQAGPWTQPTPPRSPADDMQQQAVGRRGVEPSRSYQQPGPQQPGFQQQQGYQSEQPRRARSFIDDQPDLPQLAPEPTGWWGRTLAAMGIKPKGPSPEQVAEHRDIQLVSQHWLGPRTVAVVNGKGGSSKTPDTALLSAIFARYGGGGVLAWDNNETRGSLGWRTEKSPSHDASVRDLVPYTAELMDARAALSQISSFVHHQPADKYDVLRSNPELLAAEQRLTREQFLAVHEVTQRYFRLTIMDSSNDESSLNYLLMLDVADQIVVATTTAPDRTESGRLLLEALQQRDDHSRDLANRAVVVVSQADREEDPGELVAARFREFMPAESVVTIPYDPGIRQMRLRYDAIQPATQRAFLRAAAAVAAHLQMMQVAAPGARYNAR